MKRGAGDRLGRCPGLGIVNAVRAVIVVSITGKRGERSLMKDVIEIGLGAILLFGVPFAIFMFGCAVFGACAL